MRTAVRTVVWAAVRTVGRYQGEAICRQRTLCTYTERIVVGQANRAYIGMKQVGPAKETPLCTIHALVQFVSEFQTSVASDETAMDNRYVANCRV